MLRTGLKRSATYYKMDEKHPLYDPFFPKSIRLSAKGRAVGWVEHECNAYLESLITQARHTNSGGKTK
jgi:prophage regulatory protein